MTAYIRKNKTVEISGNNFLEFLFFFLKYLL